MLDRTCVRKKDLKWDHSEKKMLSKAQWIYYVHDKTKLEIYSSGKSEWKQLDWYEIRLYLIAFFQIY